MAIQFGFHLPTKIEVGNKMIENLGEFTAKLIPGRRALLVTDPGIRRIGIADAAADSLEQAGFTLSWFDQVAPNPKDIDCEAGGEAAKTFRADVIVAVGGGSVLDSAKAIALLQSHPGRLRDYEGRGKVTQEVTPIVAIPTTAGTGSEVTRSAVITDTDRKFKMTIKDVKLAPRLALVDPETTYGLPSFLTATCGMDALVHAIEAYTCKAANLLSDAVALAAMEYIYPALPLAVSDGNNTSARYRMMVGSLMAGIAFSHADVAAVHCLAEALGGLYDIPHGVGNSMFLPAITAYNASADAARHARAAAACGLDIIGLSDQEAASLLVTELEQLSQQIGIPSFAGYNGVQVEDFAFLADAAEKNGSTPSNCRTIIKDDYRAILEACYFKGV
jgi:alcohol dehydrogenase